MQPFPHHYLASAAATRSGDVSLDSTGLDTLDLESPPEFGGPEGRWSPETLLVGTVAACYVLTFRALAAASGFEWFSLGCAASGTLTRLDRVTQFTEFVIHARLELPEGSDEEKARHLLAKAETQCLITNSLKAPTQLEVELVAAAVAR